MKKVSVIGAGSWGSALAVLLANNGHEVTLWTHDPHEIEMLSTKREQVEKLPGVKLPDNIMIEADLKTALTDEDVVVMAVPSPVVRMVAKQMSPFIKKTDRSLLTLQKVSKMLHIRHYRISLKKRFQMQKFAYYQGLVMQKK